MNSSIKWHDLNIRPNELRLHFTLMFGQAFRWKNVGNNTWLCALWDRVVALKETDNSIMYSIVGRKKAEPIIPSESEAQIVEQKLRDYFQLDISLDKMCQLWAHEDPNFYSVYIDKRKHGIRSIRQDPTENIFSFICSSNNNIKRITLMIDNLCKEYGHRVNLETNEFGLEYLHLFPSVSSLDDKNVEERLRELGFGYRAKYIFKSAEYINTKYKAPDEFYQFLKKCNYQEAKSELLNLTGVGPKVADCILLMSLDKTNAIPVDTHVLQIAKRDYLDNQLFMKIIKKRHSELKYDSESESILETAKELVSIVRSAKSVSTGVYNAISKMFFMIFGEYCGWAQTVLFVNDIKTPAAELKTSKPKPEKKVKTPKAENIKEESHSEGLRVSKRIKARR